MKGSPVGSAEAGAQSAQEDCRPVAVPDAGAIARLLRELLTRKVAVERIDFAPPKLDDEHVLACYADGSEELRALVLFDLRLSVASNIQGALNAFSLLFDSGAAGQIKLVGLSRADQLAVTGVMRLLDSAWAKATYTVDIFGSPVGALSVFMGGANRRGDLRIRHKAKADLYFDGCTGVRETWDISAGGLYVGEPDPPPIGAVGRIELFLEGASQRLPFSARVAWRSLSATAGGFPPGFGLQLIMMPGPEYDRFQVAVLQLIRRTVHAGPPTGGTIGRAADSPTNEADGSGPILVVDHTQYVRSQVVNCLARAGYSTMVAADGLEALEMLRRTNVRMVICEVNMPRMSGIEFLENVPHRNGRPAVPILVLTSDAEPRLVRNAKALGAQGWLMKPMQPQLLLAAVRRLLGERDAFSRA
jgi:two-component system chemotaxis response regulator CheY